MYTYQIQKIIGCYISVGFTIGMGNLIMIR